MVFVLTNTTIKQELISYFKRNDTDFLASIPFFIMLGERRVATDLKILGTKTFIDGNLIPGNPRLQKDVRWLNNASCEIGIINPDFDPNDFTTRKKILECSYLWGESYWPNPTITGEPKYYADQTYFEWAFYPTPDLAYPYRIGFFQFPNFIDDTEQSNWFTAFAPHVLWSAICLETAIYLEDGPRIPIWEAQYQKDIASLSTEDKQRMYDEYSVR